jgi:hypothetical protein
MKMLTTIKVPVLTSHQTVEPIARCMTVRVIVPHTPKFRLRTQIQHTVPPAQQWGQHNAAQMQWCPFPQTPDALPHHRTPGRIIHVPNAFADVKKQGLQVALLIKY